MQNTYKGSGKEDLLFYAANLLCCIFLLLPAFYNGYPLLNSDFGTFLPSGFLPEMPVDRPITYGILLRIFSLNGLSMWPVIFVQTFFVSILITKLVRHFYPQAYLLRSLIVVFILSCLTGLSWTASQLQPDIFTPVAFLCIAVLLIGEESKRNTILLCILYFISVATHISHVMIFFILLCALMVFMRKHFRENKRRYFLLLTLTVVPILLMTVAISKSKHMFFMASALEKGILKQYLDDNCGTKQLKLCAYKDKLPASGDDFLWEPWSPAMLEGGWKAVKSEYDQVNGDIMSSPKYLGMLAKSSARFTLIQLGTFEIGPGNVPLGEGPYVLEGFNKYLPSELDDFLSARQQQGQLLSNIAAPDMVFKYFMIFCCVLGPILFFVARKRLPDGLGFFIFISLLIILINAWDCATFAVINGRYGCRLAWLVPFTFILLIFALSARRKGFRQKY